MDLWVNRIGLVIGLVLFFRKIVVVVVSRKGELVLGRLMRELL